MAQIRLDKVHSIYEGNIETLVLDTDATNGLFYSVGDTTAQREVFKGVVPTTANLAVESFVMTAAPEVMYDERLYKRTDFFTKMGDTVRALYFTKGDYITLTSDLFDGTLPAINDFVGIVNGKTKLAKVDPATYTGTLLFKVVRLQSLASANDSFQLRCYKA